MPLDVLLITPPSSAFRPRAGVKGPSPPPGLGYLAAVLEQARYTVDVVDMQVDALRGVELGQLVRERQPRVVGLTTMVVTYKNALRLAQIIKKTSPGTKIIMGGPQATFLVEETLACPAVDVLVRREGEETLIELMRHFDGEALPLEAVRGIAFRDGSGICQTEPRPPIADLDRLPFPSRRFFKLERYAKPGVLITARGCPSRCVFCAARTLYRDSPYRSRSPESVVNEIEEMVTRYGLDSFFIADDTFTIRPQRAMEICDLILERGFRLQWVCEARVNTMTPELARKLFKAGCVEVQYGVETGNSEIMKLISKGISLDQVEQVVDYSQAAGLDVICSFIIGFPWDTWETVNQTVAFGRRLSQLGSSIPNRGGSKRGRVVSNYAPLTPLPGTSIYQDAEALGIQFLTRDWDHYCFNAPVIETPHLSAADVRKALYSVVGELYKSNSTEA